MKSGDRLLLKWRTLKLIYAGTVECYSEPDYWAKFYQVNRN